MIPGSARLFLSAEDVLIEQHAPWLTRYILECAKLSQEAPGELSGRIRSIQQGLEQQRAAIRMRLLRQDIQRDKLLTSEQSPAGAAR